MATILMDVDGVVCDLHSSWLGLYNKDYDDDLHNEEITAWDMVEFVKPECGKKIYEYLENPDIYKNALPIVGAWGGCMKIRKMGHRIVFVSAGFYPAKVEWLNRWGFLREFPYEDKRWQTATDMALVNDKSLIVGDLLIDDRYENVIDSKCLALMFMQPWNWSKRGEYKYQVDDWTHLVGFVDGIYGHA